MYLVLAPSHDSAARWVYRRLQARGVAPLEWLDPARLAGNVGWEHRVGMAGVSTELRLADGRRLRHDTIQGVLNRLVAVPAALWHVADPEDRDYAAQEWTAFFLSWLAAVPAPVLNPPTPQGLCGRWRPLSEWVWLAARAGLPASPYTQTSAPACAALSGGDWLVPADTPGRSILVVGDQVLGASAPADIRDGCRRLATLAETPLVGITFTPGAAGPWTFVGATPVPDLRRGGAALVEALVEALHRPKEIHG